MGHCRVVRLIGRGQLVELLRPFLVAQAAVADAQLDTGQITVAVRRDKTASAVIPRTGQSQGVPVGRLAVPLPLEKPPAQLTAYLRPGTVVEKGTK